MAEKENIFIHNLVFLDLSSQANKVLTLIAYRSQKGTFRQSNDKMARIFHCNRRTIVTALQILKRKDIGLIHVVNPNDTRGREIKLTPKTIEILKMNTQELMDRMEAKEEIFLIGDKVIREENFPSEDPIREENFPIQGRNLPSIREENFPQNSNSEQQSIKRIITDIDSFSKSFFLSVKSDLKKRHRDILLLEELIRFISKSKENNTQFDNYDHALNSFKSWMKKVIPKELKEDEYYRDHNFHQAMEFNFKIDAKKMLVYWKKFIPIMETLNEVKNQYDINQAFFEFLTTKKNPIYDLKEKKYIDQIEKQLMSFSP